MTSFHHYLHKLQNNDCALKKFLADPSKASEENNLTKAERSVLRRVLVGASTNSTNGNGIVRPLAAYRQGVRMMQNVMHLNMGAALAKGAQNSHSLTLYYGMNPHKPGNMPYANSKMYTGEGTTIGELMINIAQNSPEFVYNPTEGEAILSFTIDGHLYYLEPGKSGVDHDPFWFYTVNGKAGGKHAEFGADHQSYVNYPLKSGSAVFWQAIAPGPEYGFKACVMSDGEHAEGLV
jgi:hypothetical protein